MANFIEGPMIGPGSFSGPAATPTPAAGGKEVYYDSSTARQQYYDNIGMGGVSGPSPSIPPVPGYPPDEYNKNLISGGEEELSPAHDLPIDAGPPVDDELLRAAASGQPLTPDLISRLPSPSLDLTRGRFAPSPSSGAAVSPPPPPQWSAPSSGFPNTGGGVVLPGLTVRVGRGVTAQVMFSAEPQAAHWRRLLRFIEIAAEEADDGPQADADEGSRGIAVDHVEQPTARSKSRLAPVAKPGKRKPERRAARPDELAGDHAGGGGVAPASAADGT